MVKLKSRHDNIEFECLPGESVLEAARRHGIPFTSACGGRARCSTCRIWVLEGDGGTPEPGEAELKLKSRIALGPEIRLACQFRPVSDITFRRLVIDETDLALADQLRRPEGFHSGELRTVAVLFFDVAGFTGISELLPAYDVLFLLNRFFTRAGDIITAHGGYFDKAIGDGFDAIFGAEGQEDAALRSVAAALEILAAVDRAGPWMKRQYNVEFDARIGIDYGEALIGSLGPAGQERLTAIGEVTNIASRVEAANKEAGTRLLITEPLYEAVKDDVESPDFVRVRLRGAAERRTLYEIAGLSREAKRRLRPPADPSQQFYAGLRWSRIVESTSLGEGERQIIPHDDFDFVLTRHNGEVLAFNNACPHLRLPFFGVEVQANGAVPATAACSEIDTDLNIDCRWHKSIFNLKTGEIISWCERLAPDGTAPGMEYLGDVSKNRAKLETFPCREADGAIWVSFDRQS